MLELVVTLAVVLVVFALLAAMLPRQRQLAQLSESMANLKEFGSLTGQYAADNDDRYWSLSWRGDGVTTYPSRYVDLRGPFSDDINAQGAQAVEILRRLAGREDIPRITAWIANPAYTHLVLAEYAGLELPLRIAVSPADERRLAWANDPRAFDVGAFLPYQPTPDQYSKRWPYSMSYELGTVFWSPDRHSSASGVVIQGGQHNLFTWTGIVRLGNRRQNETAYPSHKAMMWDQAQRHFGERQPYFMMPEARYPVLFADGAVAVRTSADANRGWNPATPDAFPSSPTDNTGVTRVLYQPSAWEPQIPGGGLSITLDARQRFNRSGLAGRDFDGDEVR
jgi:hypothetical protein